MKRTHRCQKSMEYSQASSENLAQVKCASLVPKSTLEASAPSGSTGASDLIFLLQAMSVVCVIS
jgi:hypothetical protein